MRPYARPPGQRHRGQRGVHAELAQHVLHVGADGVRGQEQPRRHVLAAQPRHHAAQHLVLARGQRLHQPFAVRPVLAGRRQLAQDPGEQRGRQVGLLPQDSPNDGQQPRERAVLRHPARGPGLERERGPARVVPLGEDHGAHPWVGRPHPGDQRDPVRAGRRPRTRLPLDGDDSGRAAEVGVDQQDVEAAALGHRAFETAHGGRRTARPRTRRRPARPRARLRAIRRRCGGRRPREPGYEPQNPQGSGNGRRRVRSPDRVIRSCRGRRRDISALPRTGRRTRLVSTPESTPAPTGVTHQRRPGSRC